MILHLRHRHGKAFDNDIVVEGFEQVFGRQRVVNSSVFVGMKTLQVLLPNVNHLDFWMMNGIQSCARK